MEHLQWVITGAGRSGTTFLTHVFYTAGFDCGGVHPSGIGLGTSPVGGGLEHAEFFDVNKRIRAFLQKGLSVVEIAQLLEGDMRRVWPFVLKDPQYVFTWDVWEVLGIRPAHLFLCVRDPANSERSVQDTDWLKDDPGFCSRIYREVYRLIAHCLEADIPYTLVHYPRIGTDQGYAERILSPFIPIAGTFVGSVWQPAMQHHQPAVLDTRLT